MQLGSKLNTLNNGKHYNLYSITNLIQRANNQEAIQIIIAQANVIVTLNCCMHSCIVDEKPCKCNVYGHQGFLLEHIDGGLRIHAHPRKAEKE
jgi:hypothetical protein